MRRPFICTLLVFSVLIFYCTILYSEEDEKKVQSQTYYSSSSQETSSVNAQRKKSTIHNLKSTPIETPAPLPDIISDVVPIPIIDNVAGRVVALSSEEDEVLWIEVKDEFFLFDTLRIRVDPKKTSIIGRDDSSSFNDIKIGDVVDVVFNQENEESIATFISILNKQNNLPPEE